MKPEKSEEWRWRRTDSLIRARRLCSVGVEGGFVGGDEVEEVGDTTSPVLDQESSLRLSLVILKRQKQRLTYAPQAICSVAGANEGFGTVGRKIKKCVPLLAGLYITPTK